MQLLLLDDAQSDVWPWGQVSVLAAMCQLDPDGGAALSLSEVHATQPKHTRSQTKRALLALDARGAIEMLADGLEDDEPVFAHPGALSLKRVSSQRYARQIRKQTRKGTFKPKEYTPRLHRRSRLSALAKS
jgi:hypothetical protein